ncbi:MAG TPA: hypothetical protein VMZ27_13955 [Candidatus Saccharimonadales bacterium]|nr:hypothetical protein [Candidatus Saccharimonadales bacterium]
MADNLPDVYLRFVGATPDIPGESMDAAYPAKEGWLEIKEFDFGFGWNGSAAGGGAKHDAITKKLSTGKPLSAQEADELSNALKPKEAEKDGKAKKTDQALQPNPCTFSRSPGVASIPLLKVLRAGGDPIPKAEIIVCRASAEALSPTEKDFKKAKIPFLQLVLERVTLVDCKMSIAKEDAPTESVEFKFYKATIQTIWTDNATGEKTAGGVLSAWFDFEKTEGHVSWAEGEAGGF